MKRIVCASLSEIISNVPLLLFGYIPCCQTPCCIHQICVEVPLRTSSSPPPALTWNSVAARWYIVGRMYLGFSWYVARTSLPAFDAYKNMTHALPPLPVEQVENKPNHVAVGIFFLFRCLH